jgi:hypothetical protein
MRTIVFEDPTRGLLETSIASAAAAEVLVMFDCVPHIHTHSMQYCTNSTLLYQRRMSAQQALPCYYDAVA